MLEDETRVRSAASAIPFAVPSNRWSDAEAAGMSPEGLLLYRSNLLGSDLTVTNFGGGNTSAKLETADPLTGERRQRCCGSRDRAATSAR
jgi:uncharacterized protein (DUF2237 family)